MSAFVYLVWLLFIQLGETKYHSQRGKWKGMTPIGFEPTSPGLSSHHSTSCAIATVDSFKGFLPHVCHIARDFCSINFQLSSKNKFFLIRCSFYWSIFHSWFDFLKLDLIQNLDSIHNWGLRFRFQVSNFTASAFDQKTGETTHRASSPMSHQHTQKLISLDLRSLTMLSKLVRAFILRLPDL